MLRPKPKVMVAICSWVFLGIGAQEHSRNTLAHRVDGGKPSICSCVPEISTHNGHARVHVCVHTRPYKVETRNIGTERGSSPTAPRFNVFLKCSCGHFARNIRNTPQGLSRITSPHNMANPPCDLLRVYRCPRTSPQGEALVRVFRMQRNAVEGPCAALGDQEVS